MNGRKKVRVVTKKSNSPSPASLPVHTFEASPPANTTKSTKTFAAAIISIALVIILILFLFIGSKFVGKAYSPGGGNEIDIVYTPEGKVRVAVTLASRVDAAGIYMELQSATPGFDLCTSLGGTNNIVHGLWGEEAGFYDVSCMGGVLRVADATLGDNFRSGTFTIAEFPLSAAPPTLNVMLTTIDVYDSDGIDLFPRGNIAFTIVSPTCINGRARSCEGTGVGACATAGTQTCQNENWGVCVGAGTASTEICDQKDNDCDGSVDESNVCSPVEVCSATTLNNCMTQAECTANQGIWTNLNENDEVDEQSCVQCVSDSNCANGQTCQANRCQTPLSVLPVCGNGILENTEQCDDRNAAAQDGCSSTCQIESFYDCTGVPSVCSRQRLVVSSSMFSSGELIPDVYTCNGRNVNPPLTISNIPTGTASLLVIMEDPDINLDPQVNPEIPVVHWAVLNIPVPAATTTLTIAEAATFTASSTISINEVDERRTYYGPCPPAGESHRYRFIVYALSSTVGEQGLSSGTPAVIRSSTVEDVLDSRIITSGSLSGIYPAAVAAREEPRQNGGGSRCRSEWSCPSTWNYCNATLQQSRTCTDINRCDPRKLTKLENRSCAACEESWVCTPWNACQNGQQTRSCSDEHSCGAVLQKPVLQKSCQQVVEPGPAPVRVQPQLPPPQIQQPAPVPSFWELYKLFIIGVPAALIMIILIVLGVLHIFKPKPVAYNIAELKEWIDKEKAMGTSPADIKTLLTEHTGWSKEDIESKFNELKEETAKSPAA